MSEFGEIKMRVESGNMEYEELLSLIESYEDRLDMMEWCPERYEHELELREMENWLVELRLVSLSDSFIY